MYNSFFLARGIFLFVLFVVNDALKCYPDDTSVCPCSLVIYDLLLGNILMSFGHHQFA